MLLKPRLPLIYFFFLLLSLSQSRLSGIITANYVWYLSVWLWRWPNAAFVVSKSHAIIKKIYPLAQILTGYRTYSFLRKNKSASFITIIAFVFVVGASCCLVSAVMGSCFIEDWLPNAWLFLFLQTLLYTLHVIIVTSYLLFNAPEHISSLMFFAQLVIDGLKH